jgi:hypothetical protein
MIDEKGHDPDKGRRRDLFYAVELEPDSRVPLQAAENKQTDFSEGKHNGPGSRRQGGQVEFVPVPESHIGEKDKTEKHGPAAENGRDNLEIAKEIGTEIHGDDPL